jgi:uncharacterized protein YwqG
MSSAGLQSVTDIDTALTNGWTAANVDSTTPEIRDNLTTPWESLDFGIKDIIYIKYDIETVKTTLYALEFFHNIAVTIEVMTAVSRARFKKLMDETMRIIKANARLSGYAKLTIRDTRVRYNKDRRIFLGQIDVDLLITKTS